MNDIISREAVADAINGIECTRHTTWYEFYQKVMTAVEKLPSAQPEIIHCMDCKYWHSGSCEYPERVVNCQDYYVGDIETEAEHFCGYAERRTEWMT